MLKKNEFINLMSLKSVNGLGNKRIILLVRHFEESSLIFSSKNSDFKSFNFITKNILNELNTAIKGNSKAFENIYNHCVNNKIDIISYFDKIYPEKLKTISNPPLLLFLKGKSKLLDSEMIAVVGSRKSSESALKYGLNISKELSKKGYVIVSGGAIGIDAAAHKGALENNGETVSVLPSGFDNLYPKENLELFSRIEKRGLLVSEYSPQKKADRFSLLERNRITSGLSDCVFIVSSSVDGGAMAQFKRAYEQKKKIFCPTMNFKIEPFEGILKLINEQKTIPVRNVNELITQIKKAKKERFFQSDLSSNRLIKSQYLDIYSNRMIPV